MLIDMRTVILSYIASDALCVGVLASLWVQDRRRYGGLGFWLANAVIQLLGLVLIAVRGFVPDILSATASNAMFIGGTILLYEGLGRFLGKATKQIHNIILLGLFVLVHVYFLLVVPDMDIRAILLSLGLLIVCAQCAWFLLHGGDAETRRITGSLGTVFLGYVILSAFRVIAILVLPLGNDFFHSTLLDTWVILGYQMLFIVLTMALFLTVNRRLTADLEGGIMARQRAEAALQHSEVHYRRTLDTLLEGCQIIGFDWRYTYLNPSAEEHNRRPNSELLGKLYLEAWPGTEDNPVYPRLKRCMEQRIPSQLENETTFPDGVRRWFELRIQPVPEGTFILSMDITERKQAEETTAFLATIVESTDDAIFGKSLDGTILTWNAGAERMYGYTAEEIRGRPASALAPADRQDEMLQILERLRAGELIQHLETERIRKDGMRINVALTISAILDRNGHITGASTIARDISQRKQMERQLQKLSRAVEQSPSSIIITDTQGTIEYVNPRFTQLTGYSPEEIIGQNPRVLQSGRTPLATYQALWEALPQGKEFRGEFANRKKNGELYYEWGIFSPIMDSGGAITHYLSVSEDITERKRAEAEIQSLQTQLREQAIRDPLTGLYNRRYLAESLERELARAQRENCPLSFVMVDIDHFKQLNDTLGHPAGDLVLKKLAAQILGQARASDIVCRYGGEEFLAVLPGTDAEGACQMAERWRVSFMESTMPLESGQGGTTISCGVSEFPAHGVTADELITAADRAMYQAKAAGRNQVKVWQPDRAGRSADSDLLN